MFGRPKPLSDPSHMWCSKGGTEWDPKLQRHECGLRDLFRDVPVGSIVSVPPMRVFETGATRDGDADKLDYEGFLSPRVLERYARYMHKHRQQTDGKLRDSDNWQKGIPRSAYMKSAWRHFMDVWTRWRSGYFDVPETEEALCALLFNVMGLLHETVVPPVTAKDEFKRAADAIAKIPESEMAIFPERHTAP